MLIIHLQYNVAERQSSRVGWKLIIKTRETGAWILGGAVRLQPSLELYRRVSFIGHLVYLDPGSVCVLPRMRRLSIGSGPSPGPTKDQLCKCRL